MVGGHVFAASASPTVDPEQTLAMSPSSTVHGDQYDAEHDSWVDSASGTRGGDNFLELLYLLIFLTNFVANSSNNRSTSSSCHGVSLLPNGHMALPHVLLFKILSRSVALVNVSWRRSARAGELPQTCRCARIK